MRAGFLIGVLMLLAACTNTQEKRTTFTCPNGPDLVVVYEDDAATLVFPSERVERLPKSKENLYAKPGVVWQLTGFRLARLTDGQSSYSCDQMAG